jgi:hypothetical protein
MMNKMKYVLVLLLATFGVMMSCEKTSNACDEDKVCYTQKPDSLYIELQLSTSPSDDLVQVNFYIGNSDDGELYYSFETNNTTEYFLMPVNKKYSAEAIYKEPGKTTVAVDGDRLEPDYFMNCDQECYKWDEDLIFDLKLKD